MKTSFIYLVLFCALIFSNCNGANDKLTGNWQAEGHTWQAKIIKEGTQLMLIGGGIYHPDSKYPLLNDGTNFYVEEPFGKMVLIYNSASDKINFNGVDWNRVP
jgi:hypothetical protein